MKKTNLIFLLSALLLTVSLVACGTAEDEIVPGTMPMTSVGLGGGTAATGRMDAPYGAETAPMTELGILMIVVGDETITVDGIVYKACEPYGPATETVVGTVSASEKAELVGQTVYTTELVGVVAIAGENGVGGWVNYRYVGTENGGSMADLMRVFAISTDTVNRIDLCANALNREETNGEIVSFTPHRLTITDATAVGELLNAMAAMERDATAYEALLAATDQPYEGYVRVELLHQNADGSLRDYGSFVYYPKLGFTNDGYRMSEALVALIEAHLGGQQ